MSRLAPAPVLRRDLERIRRAHLAVAKLTAANPAAAPIFARLEAELAKAEATTIADPIERARAVVRHRAMA